MRQTLHEYTIEQLSTLDCTAVSDVLNYAKLTNCKPRLSDFIPCDEDGNVLEDPKEWIHEVGKNYGYQSQMEKYKWAQSRVIFKGEWHISYLGKNLTVISCGAISIDFFNNGLIFTTGGEIHRIEDLPRTIEFKDGVI